MENLFKTRFASKKMNAFSLPELLVVLVIIGILVLIALPNLMPLISKAKSVEAQQQLVFLHSLQQSYFFTHSKYSSSLDELGFEQQPLVTEDGTANYRIEIIEADEKGYRAQAVAVVDFNRNGKYNTWEINQEKKLRETERD
ncbi:MAG: type II secretion system protein [Bacteroidota bacterium]|nr:type II secretion system protein [Bacteroidota bacterium]